MMKSLPGLLVLPNWWYMQHMAILFGKVSLYLAKYKDFTYFYITDVNNWVVLKYATILVKSTNKMSLEKFSNSSFLKHNTKPKFLTYNNTESQKNFRFSVWIGNRTMHGEIMQQLPLFITKIMEISLLIDNEYILTKKKILKLRSIQQTHTHIFSRTQVMTISEMTTVYQ